MNRNSVFGALKMLALYWLIVKPQSAYAASSLDNAMTKLRGFAESSGADVSDNPAVIVGRIVNQALGVLGVIAVGLIVYAGGVWITAAGNEDKVTEAKKIIKTTVIGMVVLGLAYAITSFIVSLVA